METLFRGIFDTDMTRVIPVADFLLCVGVALAAGLLLGWQKFILAMLIASVAGAAVMTLLNRIQKADKQTEHPFGPYLAAGTLIAMLAGDGIIGWYTDLLMGMLI